MTKEQFLAILIGEFDYHPDFALSLWEDEPDGKPGIETKVKQHLEQGEPNESLLERTRETAEAVKYLDDLYRLYHPPYDKTKKMAN